MQFQNKKNVHAKDTFTLVIIEKAEIRSISKILIYETIHFLI